MSGPSKFPFLVRDRRSWSRRLSGHFSGISSALFATSRRSITNTRSIYDSPFLNRAPATAPPALPSALPSDVTSPSYIGIPTRRSRNGYLSSVLSRTYLRPVDLLWLRLLSTGWLLKYNLGIHRPNLLRFLVFRLWSMVATVSAL